MVSQLGTATQRLNTVNINGVVEESREEACRIGAAANASNDSVGKLTRHAQKLLSCLLAHNVLEVTHHEGERMRAENASDAVDAVLVLVCVCRKSRVNSLLQGLKTFCDLDDVCTENLHSRYVGSLLFDVHRTHVNVTFKTKVSRRCR